MIQYLSFDSGSQFNQPVCMNDKWIRGRCWKGVMVVITSWLWGAGCTQETQNQWSRAVQNWTGTDGVLEIYAGEVLVRRFIHIDKLSTAQSTQGTVVQRPYRYGYGVLDANLNFSADAGEKKVYFEFSDYSTSYVFFENPQP